MTDKKRSVALAGMCAVLGLMFLFFVFTVPIDLSVKVLPEKIYAGEQLTTKDFEVRTKTFFGVKREAKSFSVVPSEGNVSVLVMCESLQKKVHIDAIKATELTATYDGSVYVGQTADVKKAAIRATYEDGTSGEIKKVWVGSTAVPNVKDKYPLKIYCDLGDACVDVPVIVPDSMSASYVGDAVIGQEFTFSKVDVQLHYADKTSYRTQEFVVSDSKTDMDGNTIEYEKVKNNLELLSYPIYLTDEVNLFAITPYGVTEFSVSPTDMDMLTAKYDGVVYEGDTLDDSKVSVSMSTDGKSQQNVKDFKFTNPGPIAMTMDIRIPTKYGTAVLKIDPIKVKDVKVDVGDDIVEGDAAEIKSLSLVYEDDTERSLDLDEVEFLNMPKTWQSSQTIWFCYHRVEYSFDVDTILKGVADLRSDKTQLQKYQVSDKDIEVLTLICQRIGNKSLTVNANEIALMANRYELYGSGESTSADLLAYVKSSGYWGTADSIDSIIADSSVNADVEQVVRDALSNGYRSLPQYVDERVLSSDVDGAIGTYSENQLLTTKKGLDLYFYKSELDDKSTLYVYSKSAYESVKGSSPPSVTGTESSDKDGGIVIDN